MRPLTEGTRALLIELDRHGSMYAGCDTGNASRLSSLRSRGLVRRDGMGGKWRITDAGRAFLSTPTADRTSKENGRGD